GVEPSVRRNQRAPARGDADRALARGVGHRPCDPCPSDQDRRRHGDRARSRPWAGVGRDRGREISRLTGKTALAFSSEADTGSREENALKRKPEHDPEKWIPVFRKRSCSNK